MAPPKRAVLKALKMSVIHVAFFIISWTPYTIIGTWWDGDKSGRKSNIHSRDTIDSVFGYSYSREVCTKINIWSKDIQESDYWLRVEEFYELGLVSSVALRCKIAQIR